MFCNLFISKVGLKPPTLATLLFRPYIEGVDNLTYSIANKRFLEHEVADPKPLTLGRRILHLVAALLLIIPIVNVIVFVALRRFATFKDYTPEIKKFLKEMTEDSNYELCFETNCKKLEDAEVVFIGERHANPCIRRTNTLAVQRLCKDCKTTPVIYNELAEGEIGATEMIDVTKISKEIPHHCWDKKGDITDEFRLKLDKVLRLSKITADCAKKVFDLIRRPTTTTNEELKKEFEIACDTLQKQGNEKIEDQIPDKPEGIIDTRFFQPIDNVICSLLRLTYQTLREVATNTLARRQKAMVEKLTKEQNSTNRRRVIVLAGSRHFVDRVSGTKVQWEQNIEEYLKKSNVRYLLLYPNDKEIKPIDVPFREDRDPEEQSKNPITELCLRADRKTLQSGLTRMEHYCLKMEEVMNKYASSLKANRANTTLPVNS